MCTPEYYFLLSGKYVCSPQLVWSTNWYCPDNGFRRPSLIGTACTNFLTLSARTWWKYLDKWFRRLSTRTNWKYMAWYCMYYALAGVVKSRRSRGGVPERWSLAAVVTADVSRAEFFLYLARNCYDPVRARYLDWHRGWSRGPSPIGSILRRHIELAWGERQTLSMYYMQRTSNDPRSGLSGCLTLTCVLPCMRVPRSPIDTYHRVVYIAPSLFASSSS